MDKNIVVSKTLVLESMKHKRSASRFFKSLIRNLRSLSSGIDSKYSGDISIKYSNKSPFVERNITMTHNAYGPSLELNIFEGSTRKNRKLHDTTMVIILSGQPIDIILYLKSSLMALEYAAIAKMYTDTPWIEEDTGDIIDDDMKHRIVPIDSNKNKTG